MTTTMMGTIWSACWSGGYGFVRSNGEDYYFKQSDNAGLPKLPRIGLRVEFEPFQHPKGWRARNIKVI